MDVATVLWCTGFRPDFAWSTCRSSTRTAPRYTTAASSASQPGLYFLGLWFLSAFTSSLLGGVGSDAGAHREAPRVASAAGASPHRRLAGPIGRPARASPLGLVQALSPAFVDPVVVRDQMGRRQPVGLGEQRGRLGGPALRGRDPRQRVQRQRLGLRVVPLERPGAGRPRRRPARRPGGRQAARRPRRRPSRTTGGPSPPGRGPRRPGRGRAAPGPAGSATARRSAGRRPPGRWRWRARTRSPRRPARRSAAYARPRLARCSDPAAEEAEACGRGGRPGQVRDRVGEPVLGLRQRAQHAPRRGSERPVVAEGTISAAPRRRPPGRAPISPSAISAQAVSSQPAPSSQPGRAAELGQLARAASALLRPALLAAHERQDAAAPAPPHRVGVGDRAIARRVDVGERPGPGCRRTPRASRRAAAPSPGPGRGRRRRPRRSACRIRSRRRRRRRRGTPRPSRNRRRSAVPAPGRARRAQASAASILARSARTSARCSAWSGPRTPVLGPVGRRGEPGRVRARGDVGRAGLAQPVAAEGPDAVQQPVADRARRADVDADQRAVDEPVDDVQAEAAGTPSAPRTCSAAASGAPPEKQASAHSPRWSSGNSRS